MPTYFFTKKYKDRTGRVKNNPSELTNQPVPDRRQMPSIIISIIAENIKKIIKNEAVYHHSSSARFTLNIEM